MLRFRPFVLCLAALTLMFGSTFSIAQQALTNDSVIKLEKAGLGDDIIIQTINSQPGQYSTSANDLAALKSAGVSQRVIAAMIVKGTTAAPAAVQASATSIPGVDEVGVYYKSRDDKWVEMEPEIVNFKSGGFMKSLVTDGIVKMDRNGHLPGRSSKLALTKPVEILIYTPEGTAPEEYQLLKMRVNSNNREFRSMTGGVFHSSTGGQRDNIDFTTTKLGPRRYTFTLDKDIVPAEYGLLPPGTQSTSNAVNAGKIYTFHVME